jgi:hypothetical protein
MMSIHGESHTFDGGFPMRTILPFIVTAVVLAGCQTSANQEASNHEWCTEYYGLEKGFSDYSYCVKNDGEPFTRPWLE